MAACSKIRKKKRQICIGDLRDLIKIQSRNIAEPLFNSVDFNENFVDVSEVWSLINTVDGKTFFDGVSTDINITHEIYINYDQTVTAESWVEFESRRFDILRVEDLDERHQFMKLICAERGVNTIEATKA